MDLYLLNIQGMITNKRNKCASIKDLTAVNNRQQIIAVTETWAREHFDAEYTKAFHGYNIRRADRSYNYDPNDEHQLISRGGCMIITTPGISIKPVEEFSNGNCEIIIAELPTIKSMVLTIYRPPGKNFSLKKFGEVLGKARKHLSEWTERQRGGNILLMGDFNFPRDIVMWEKIDSGTVPNYQDGLTEEKRAFQLLLDLTEEFDLEQIVDKPTRGRNILDLIFTNKPCVTTECQVSVLKPLSDHKLVHTTIHAENQVTSNSNKNQQKIEEVFQRVRLEPNNQR